MVKVREKFQSRYFKLGLTIFMSGVGLILFYGFVTNYEKFIGVFQFLGNVLFPFILGFVIAYLLCPIYNFTVRKTYHWTAGAFKSGSGALKFSRFVATIVSIGFFVIIIGGLLWMVLPELIKSVFGIVETTPGRISELIAATQDAIENSKYEFLSNSLRKTLGNVQGYLVEWSKGGLMESLGMYIQRITEGVWFTFKTVINLLVAIIVAVYLLNGKELFRAQIKKLIMATLKKEDSDALMEFATFTDKTFGGFINGKIIDSFIIGVLCFILMTLIGLPYAILISAIVGITNIIPFFGPFIGAIPSIIILLTVNPMDALYFAIMILGLQQLDGNVIGPKILGGTIGLPSFWVMFAIVVGGGLFGFLGMVLGVPVFAVIYYYFRKFVDKKLMKKNMPLPTSEYVDFNKYDINRKDVQ